MDACVSGSLLKIYGSPAMKNIVNTALKDVSSVDKPEQSYHEFFQDYYPDKNFSELVTVPGSGSDHAHFAYFAGVPVTYHTFK